MRWSTRNLILAGSVAANLLLLGFLVGVGARLAGPGAAPPPVNDIAADPNPRALFMSMTDEQREALFREMRGEGQRSASIFRELRDAREDFQSAAVAEPYDEAAAREALERRRAATLTLQERGDDLMLRVLADLTPEQRAMAIEQMNEMARRFGERRRLRRDAPGGGPGFDGPGRDGPPSAPPQE